MNTTAAKRLMYAEDILDHALRNRQFRRIALASYAISILRPEANVERRMEVIASAKEQLLNAINAIMPTRHEQK